VHAVLARVELVWASGQGTSSAPLQATRTMLVREGVAGQAFFATPDASQPWISVRFRLVALRGGR
jgi:hypothetical protein